MAIDLSGQTGRSILISGASPYRTAALQTEFKKTTDTRSVSVNLDNLIANNQLDEVNTQISSAFSMLSKIDVFVIDTMTHEPQGSDAIWDVPLNIWNRDCTPHIGQTRMLLQIQAFLREHLRRAQSPKSAPLEGFSIIILGYRDVFGSVLDQLIFKLRRDVAWLHHDAFVTFLALESAANEVSIASGIRLLTTKQPEDRIVYLSNISALGDYKAAATKAGQSAQVSIRSFLGAKRPKVKIALSFDFDALSGLIGTGDHPDNNMNDYSAGVFAGRVGAARLLRMLQKHSIADKVTWFIPGHTMESFRPICEEIVRSGAEIGLHGYAHEGASQMTPAQERDVLVKCMEVARSFTGKKVRGYRAPMYNLRETTVEHLKDLGFLYDSSLGHHDCQLYLTPSDAPVTRIDFTQPASSWMHPTPLAPVNTPVGHPLVEIPTNWHIEDMMSMQYLPHLANSQGHVDPCLMERLWQDRFFWFWENHGAGVGQQEEDFIFPLLMHPDTSGQAHVIPMADRIIGWLRSWGDLVEFQTCESIAEEWLERKGL